MGVYIQYIIYNNSQPISHHTRLLVNDSVIGFSGELSPWSNLHKSPFEIKGIKFMKHWIQYTKSNLFGDTLTSNQILNSENAMEAKRLGYNIHGYNPKIWHEKGYQLCLPGIKAK